MTFLDGRIAQPECVKAKGVPEILRHNSLKNNKKNYGVRNFEKFWQIMPCRIQEIFFPWAAGVRHLLPRARRHNGGVSCFVVVRMEADMPLSPSKLSGFRARL
ncbi:hypothetical protein [Eilatimonas milleporae]|uniref:hypothetical protein n=1 Tax=Eilatimonas milleporae TaxID=911205 RepID=UPI0011C377B7|nr:hypothetical protein [Eilatimonas milleporae]